MNKTAIKNYSVWARNELIDQVTRKAFEYEVKKDIKSDEKKYIYHSHLLRVSIYWFYDLFCILRS